MVKMPTNEVARSSPLFVLVADHDPDQFDYRGLLADANMNWAFVTNSNIFSAALRLQPWDVILVDEAMIEDIPSELLASAEIEEESHEIVLLISQSALDDLAQGSSLLDLCGYLIKGPSFTASLRRQLRRNLYVRALGKERSHLEQEIERILKRWEESIRDRTKNLERANQHLKALDELKSQFLANISHQLRTPLSVIRSYVELLVQCPPEEEQEAQEFLNIISSETHRLSQMIDDLLDLARIESGRMVWNMREISLKDLITEVISPLRSILDREGLEISVLCPDDLPPIQADPDRLSQVINNVIDNSIKHTPESGKIIIEAELISVDTEGSPGVQPDMQEFIKVIVTDTGPGIPANKLESIFSRFEQATDKRGAGLGLAISREVITHHGGKIWAESPESLGARVIFTVPLAGHIDIISGTFDPPPPGV